MAQDEDADTTRRAGKRDSLFLMTDLRRADGAVVGPARVRNLSASGMMAESPAMLTEGDAISFELRGIGTMTATISWARDGRLGIAFDAPIDPMNVRRPVARKATGPHTQQPTKFRPSAGQRRTLS